MNKLSLFSKIDIPFRQAKLIIHNPSILEISYIGETAFYQGCQCLTFSKDKLDEEDKNRLKDFTNFEVLMTMIRDKNVAVIQRKICMTQVLSLMFPEYQINFLPNSILLTRDNENGEKERSLIDKDNFESFKNIVSQMFCLNIEGSGNAPTYNPGGPQARMLVKKFEERRKKLAKLKHTSDSEQVSILYRYISILAVGEKKDINELMQYSVYQLFDEFRRFRKKQEYDLYVQAKMAGAKDLEQIQNWMG